MKQLESIARRVMTEHLRPVESNRAQELIEDLMVAANGATSRFLASAGFSSLQRVLRSPERWERLVELALPLGTRLPLEPDERALALFLQQRREQDRVSVQLVHTDVERGFIDFSALGGARRGLS